MTKLSLSVNRENLQLQCFVPDWVESLLDCPCLLLLILASVWDELDLDVRITETIGVHGNEVPVIANSGPSFRVTLFIN